jgi:hypothetical protein
LISAGFSAAEAGAVYGLTSRQVNEAIRELQVEILAQQDRLSL